jgi:hypothetical protein
MSRGRTVANINDLEDAPFLPAPNQMPHSLVVATINRQPRLPFIVASINIAS